MNVYFYKNFKKRTNSTKQPAVNSQDRIIDCQLKENCSIENPILRITTGSATAGWQDTLNYAYIPSWGRYYKVEDGVYAGGNIWEIHLVDDAPASNKANILQCNAFIEYSGLSGEVYVPDQRMTMRGNATMAGSSTTTMTSLFDSDLHYYVTVINDYGADCCYEFDRATFELVCNRIYTVGDNEQEEIQRQVGSVFESITSVTAMPFSLKAHKTAVTDGYVASFAFRIGENYIYDGQGQFISGAIWHPLPPDYNQVCDYCYSTDVNVSIPWDANISDFRNLAPYTEFYLWLPFYGELEIPARYLVSATQLVVRCVFSVRDGTVTYHLMCNGRTFGTHTAVIAQELAIAQVIGNQIGQMKAGLNMAQGVISSLASGNVISGIVGTAGSITNGLFNLGIAGLEKNVQTLGNTTGMSMKYLPRDITLHRFYYPPVTTPSNYKATMGAPYMRVDTLSNHAGYFVKCNSASVEISHYAGEAETINNMLNSGIYLE